MKLVGIAAALGLALAANPSFADSGVQIGRLSCEVDAGVGLLIGSRKGVSCTFHRHDGSTENYHGHITKIGLDVGFTENQQIEWLVFAAAADRYEPHALAGTYVGASGEATFGVGLGANALVGGLDRSFALQPFSVQTQTGVNLAVGLAGLTLE